ncbi:enoyl-CoA hydratase/isomerase family protein [Chitinibacter fontanus]|uniref:3-hydroxyisobutyryl-CoA hydrolase n=1 Tax=Chitinibacter fontanus TaxID=1737446 RepID=A0A7D5V7Y3_9NEIS|nr:enoyl-CoA hydratase/isomerase family protein [Chitinibacter fontanus]QLI80577.1 enoyl-CoA hydratase/isomerase family protein [Chitinibacter fontanus]
MTVHVSLLQCAQGQQIGCLALSAPERINAQNLAMVRQMDAALAQWRDDEQIVAVVLLGAGERGFCAGGDLKALYLAMSKPEQLCQGDAFFSEEYRLCQTIREYPKPVLAWGHGIVMGGGWGLFAAASHRIVTESSRLAMPETGIGLFPDVAASWWLPKLAGAGRFLALTGAAINARDAMALGAADWLLPDSQRHATLMAMAQLAWSGQSDTDAALLSEFLDAQPLPAHIPAAKLTAEPQYYQQLNALTLPQALAYLATLAHSSDTYLQHAAQRVLKASPTSLYLSWALQQLCAPKTLAQTVQIETSIAASALRYGDFQAGIYSTLIDRQLAPRWRYRTPAELDLAEIATYFPALQLGIED